MAKVVAVIAFLAVPLHLLSHTDAQSGHKAEARSHSRIERLITDSAWAKPVIVQVKGDNWEPNGTRLGAHNADTGLADGTNASGRIPTVGSSGSVVRPPSVVRWDSAAPVREACAKAGLEPYAFSCYSKIMFVSGQAEKFDALAKEFYILTISNYPKAALPRRDQDAPQHSTAANAALDRLGERLKNKTFLKRKGKEDIAPEKVLVLPAGQNLLVVAFFSRFVSITVQDGSIVFESINDPVMIRSRFNVNKMLVNGKLEL
ncbi:MAG: hypothetical protein ACJ746_02725 [Bryobacteraceae bacterium]